MRRPLLSSSWVYLKTPISTIWIGLFQLWVCLVVVKIPSCLTCDCLTSIRCARCMSNRLSRRRRKAYQTALTALLVMTITVIEYGNSTRWMPTTLQHGVKVVTPPSRTARCCARPIIGLRGINSRNNNLTNFKKLRKGWGCVKIDESRYA